jgi:hypothetical protein
MLLTLRKHDGHVEDIEVLGSSFARKIATAFDWDAERRRFEQLVEVEAEAYFPSMALTNDADRTLEFGPNTDDTFWVTYRYSVLKSSWGFTAVPRDVELELEACTLEEALALMEQHYEGQHEEIVRALPSARTPEVSE